MTSLAAALYALIGYATAWALMVVHLDVQNFRMEDHMFFGFTILFWPIFWGLFLVAAIAWMLTLPIR